jgi:hypothetical protein
MRISRLLALACAAALSTAAGAADSPFSAFKGKMKDGMYEYKMTMDMGQSPGMPAGMAPQSMTMQHCLKNADIEKNGFAKGRDGKGMPENCKVDNFKMSGNTASYTMVCKGGPDMTADTVITFMSDGFKQDMKMAMASQQGRPAMNMTQHMEGKYVGPCPATPSK